MIAKRYFKYSIILIVALTTGCVTNIAIKDPSIPKPHFEKLSLIVALRLPNEFYNFVHKENVLGQESWTIDLGTSNATFFTQLFEYMFDDLIVLRPDDDTLNYTFDALIEPEIEGFEISVPNQSKTNEFVVWIRYRMQVYDKIGNNTSTWSVSAYGKSQIKGLGRKKSLQRAATLAMRDAAALILLQMDKATKIGTLADGPTTVNKTESDGISVKNLNNEKPMVLNTSTFGDADEITN